MIVHLTADEVRRAIARAAVEKAYSPETPYRWSESLGIVGLYDAPEVTASLQDGYARRVLLCRKAPAEPLVESDEVPF